MPDHQRTGALTALMFALIRGLLGYIGAVLFVIVLVIFVGIWVHIAHTHRAHRAQRPWRAVSEQHRPRTASTARLAH